ncbi:amino-acid N-acetyltransferase [Devriesea agamarum]|uniref:amino-acid N-acetyltransferase n=1 Tax=Devriesea agamarum TaxID=472569 RepID=UPI0009FC401F
MTTSPDNSTSARSQLAGGAADGDLAIRPAKPRDVAAINRLVQPLVEQRILLAKDLVTYYEDIQEFFVAENTSGDIIGCGALHVMWEDLAEVRTLATDADCRSRGVGHALLTRLIDRARELELRRVFCLTFEVDFFIRHGFEPMGEDTVDPQVFLELVRSLDTGVAQFLDLARVKPNTLGNTRMILHL